MFPRNKVTVDLKLDLLASHMAEILIENLRKTSECDAIFAKQRPQTLHVALSNMCYVFHVVFIKHKMMYSVAYNCTKKHTSNTNDYIPRVIIVKTRSETTPLPLKLQRNG